MLDSTHSLVWSTKPCPSNWANSLIPTTLEMCDDAIGIANKGSIVEGKVAHRTPPGRGKREKKETDVDVHVGIKETTF